MIPGHGGGEALTPRRRFRAISLTPLIDVVFILLMFFMLTSQFLHQRGLDLAVSSNMAAALTSAEDMQYLKLQADGQLITGAGDALGECRKGADSADWVARVGAAQPRITLRQAPAVTVQQLVSCLETLQFAGLTQVQLGELLPLGETNAR